MENINELVQRYHQKAKNLDGKLSDITMIETSIGEREGFYYNQNVIFFDDDTMLVQNKGDENDIREISIYEIEEL